MAMKVPKPIGPPLLPLVPLVHSIVPGLVNIQKAIENGHEEWIYPLKNGGSFHSYVSLPEGIRYYQVPTSCDNLHVTTCPIFSWGTTTYRRRV